MPRLLRLDGKRRDSGPLRPLSMEYEIVKKVCSAMKKALFSILAGLLVLAMLLPGATAAAVSALPGSSSGGAVPLTLSKYSSASALPTEGMSNAGTRLKDIRYDRGGNILSLSELFNGSWIHWTYEYDMNGRFLYRYRNIGPVSCTLTSKFMPGTDTTYSELSVPVENCVGFTLRYEVTKVSAGDGLGDRYMYVYDGRAWTLLSTFSYSRYGVSYDFFTFDEPTTLLRFATPRIHPDKSRFMIAQTLEDVITADYCYIAPEGDRNATWVVPNIYTESRPHPGPQDMAGCKSGVWVPNPESWLDEYETKYVRASRGRAAYLRYAPDLDYGYFDLVKEGTEVTILARQDGASLAKVRDGVVGWIGSSQLGDY